jgi:hypothetical protein
MHAPGGCEYFAISPAQYCDRAMMSLGCPMIDLHQARFAHQRPVQSIL